MIDPDAMDHGSTGAIMKTSRTTYRAIQRQPNALGTPLEPIAVGLLSLAIVALIALSSLSFEAASANPNPDVEAPPLHVIALNGH